MAIVVLRGDQAAGRKATPSRIGAQPAKAMLGHSLRSAPQGNPPRGLPQLRRGNSRGPRLRGSRGSGRDIWTARRPRR